MTEHKIKHFLSFCETIQSRVYDADTGEEISFVKMSLDEANLCKKREWVGLTLDEIALINQDYPNPQGFALAIQAKLKEKNT